MRRTHDPHLLKSGRRSWRVLAGVLTWLLTCMFVALRLVGLEGRSGRFWRDGRGVKRGAGRKKGSAIRLVRALNEANVSKMDTSDEALNHRKTSESHQSLQEAAGLTSSFAARVFAEGGIAQQIAAGEWNERVDDRSAQDLTEMWRAVGEHIRHARAVSGEEGVPGLSQPALGSKAGLPLNRKERYYTGTVLPMLTGSDGFAHLHRFLRLCGLDVDVQANLLGNQELQFYTEYGFAESVVTDADRQRWPDAVGADTPDVVLAGADWLLAVEAKMFHDPTPADLDAQMQRQASVIQAWVKTLGLDPGRVAHVLLLPEPLAATADGLDWPIVTWQQVLDEYKTVGPRYWAQVLSEALDHYDNLVSKSPAFGSNSSRRMRGAEIVAAHAMGGLEFDYVGRAGGVSGAKFQEDLATGRWRTFAYEVRAGELSGNRNWFSIADFVVATADD